MRIVSLIDNKKKNSLLIKEHGLSFYIECNDKKIIFDTGASGDFISNADSLGVKIEEVDYAIISHGHSDHCGGLFRFLHLNTKAKVILRENAKKDFYGCYLCFKKYIGLDKKLIEKFKDRFIFINEDFNLNDDFHIITNIKQNPEFFNRSNRLKVLKGMNLVEDNFDHELILVGKENDDLFIFTGCSHNGVVGMIETVREIYPTNKIKALVGGFHFKGSSIFKPLNCSKSYIHLLANKLKDFNIEKIYTCHCTTKKGFKLLKKDLNNIEYMHTGKEANFNS